MSHPLPSQSCPACGKAGLDRATAATTSKDLKPTAGDITLCIYCGEILSFDPNLRLRVTTRFERRSWPKQIQLELTLLQMKWFEVTGATPKPQDLWQ